jgi:hypothetical protein
VIYPQTLYLYLYLYTSVPVSDAAHDAADVSMSINTSVMSASAPVRDLSLDSVSVPVSIPTSVSVSPISLSRERD